MKSLKIIDVIRNSLFLLIMMTTFYSTIPHLLLGLLLLFLVFLKKNLNVKINLIYLIPLFIFLISVINTLVNVSFNVNSNDAMILLRARKFLAEIIVAYSMLFFCINTSRETILRLLYMAIYISFVIGVFQLILNPTHRPSMLFLEPSSAGYFIGTFIFVFFYKKNIFKKILLTSSILLIRSKGMLLSIILTFAFRSQNFKRYIYIYIFIFVLIILLGPSLHTFLMHNSSQYFGFIHLIDMLYSHGITGFSSTFGVYNTYLTRLTGIYFGVQSLIDNPLGLGFGAFHSVYLNHLFIYLTADDVGTEIMNSLFDGGMVTPKSNLIEQCISAGVFGITLLVFFFIKIMKGVSTYYRASVICFIILSLITELNNFYLYMLLLAYFYKGHVFDNK